MNKIAEYADEVRYHLYVFHQHSLKEY
jgi:hypothetical protein